MLLDPLEEDFHLPAILIERAGGGGGKIELIGKQHQSLAGFGNLETNPAQLAGIVLATIVAVESDGLITNDSGAAIHRRRIDAASIQIRLAARNEESSRTLQCVEPCKIQEIGIHDEIGRA